jgi:endonuclease YncB( thermonuclease family)
VTTFGPYPAKVLDWHDGDTAHIDVDLGFSQRAAAYTLDGHPVLSCRVYGINAPELSTDAGKTALAYVEQLCPPGTFVTVVSHGWDKYGGRWDGAITLPDGRDVAAEMLASGHAVVLQA